jgi:hypothetical protein
VPDQELREAIEDWLLSLGATLFGRAWDLTDSRSVQGAVDMLENAIECIYERLEQRRGS